MLVITGLFPLPNQMHDLIEAFADHEVIVGRLPGMHAPLLSETSIDAFALAYQEVVDRLFAGRRVLVVGVSTGCLVALALRCAGRVLVEPFLSTAKLAPLNGFFRTRLNLDAENAWLADYLWSLVGVSRDAVEDRNYEPLLARSPAPLWVMAGDLERPPERGLQTLCYADDRRLLSAAGAKFIDSQPRGGHGFASEPEGKARLLAVVREALDAVERGDRA